MKFLEDPHIRKIAIIKLVSDPSERTFSISGELFNVNLINEIPTDYDIHMKIIHIWTTYDKASKCAYC
jgi:hypothetical protein